MNDLRRHALQLRARPVEAGVQAQVHILQRVTDAADYEVRSERPAQAGLATQNALTVLVVDADEIVIVVVSLDGEFEFLFEEPRLDPCGDEVLALGANLEPQSCALAPTHEERRVENIEVRL